jgi:hypothetical protein
MSGPEPAPAPFARLRALRGRLGAFVLVAAFALAAPWLTRVSKADWIVRRFTYAVLLLTAALFALALIRLWRARVGTLPPRRELLAAGSLIGLCSALAISAEPFRCKVIFDEYVLQGTALNLHHHRIASTFAGGYPVLGEFLPFRNYLDKRPGFYPFLVSLIHDLTGHRPSNAFLLNALLYPLALVLAYFVGRRLHGPWGGRLAVVLLGTLPLLGQNATGSGMDLLNVCMILAVAGLAGAYLRQPDPARLTALVLGGVLLAHARYESALYVAPVGIIVLLGWWRQRAVVLSWPAVAAPLLLLPITLQAKVMSHTPMSWELKPGMDSRFGWAHVAGNLKGAALYLFSRSQLHSNSILLSVLGVLGVACLAVLLLRRHPFDPASKEDRAALLWLAAAALANTALLQFYFWSRFDDPMASRLSLPLALVLVFAAVLAAGELRGRVRGLSAALVAAGLLGLLAAGARYAKPLYSTTGTERVEWELGVVAGRPPADRLVLCNWSTLPLVMAEIPALRIEDLDEALPRLRHCLRESLFDEILVVQSGKPLAPGEGDGGIEIIPDDRLPAGFELQTLAERRFASKITRISRLVAIHEPSPGATPVAAAAR